MSMDSIEKKVAELSIVTTGTPMADRGAIHPGIVNIRVLAARGIKSLEILGKPDTYVVVRYGGEEHRTKEVDDCEDPVYEDDWVSTVGMAVNEFVEVSVMEKYTVQDKELCSLRFPADSFAHNILEASWFELERDGEEYGEICIGARFNPIVCSNMGRPGNSSSSSSSHFGNGAIEQAAQFLSGPRPWYMRGGFYYDLSKRVYRRVKHIPLVGLGPTMGEVVVEGVLTHIVLRQQPGELVARESGISRLDHVVAGLITTIDMGIDQTKDQVLKKAVELKKQMTGEVVVVVPPQQQMKKSSGIIWGLVEGTVTHVARPVTSYVPIVGGLGVQILDYIVPPPPPAEMSVEAKLAAAAAAATTVGGGASPIPTADVSAFDKPTKSSKLTASGY